MARRRIILFSGRLMADVIRGDAILGGPIAKDEWVLSITSDVPADLRVVGCGWDERTNSVRIAVESSTFDDIPDGYFAPEWTPTYTRHAVTEYEAAMALLGRKAP